MENRLIISFRPEDIFTGCKPKVIEQGTVDGEKSAVVNASPGIICVMCDAFKRCKKNFKIVDRKLPSEVSQFSNS
jgi:hypothetical protein